jgi:flagellar motility protein MotE (MotC chaperone)
MNKGMLLKLIIFFSISFIVILVVMTLVVGFLTPNATDSGNPSVAAVSDSTQAVADSSRETNGDSLASGTIDSAAAANNESAIAEQKKLDSLKMALSRAETEKRELEEKLKASENEVPAKNATSELANAKKVAKIYENMGAEEAATILSGLRTDEVVAIIASMKQRQAAKILAAMEPGKAVTISQKLAGLN